MNIKQGVKMSCKECEIAEHSYDKRPFCPPNGDIFDKTFVCECGQKWWQYNTFYNLWSKVDDNETFVNILNGCPRPVVVGEPSINADKIYNNNQS